MGAEPYKSVPRSKTHEQKHVCASSHCSLSMCWEWLSQTTRLNFRSVSVNLLTKIPVNKFWQLSWFGLIQKLISNIHTINNFKSILTFIFWFVRYLTNTWVGVTPAVNAKMLKISNAYKDKCWPKIIKWISCKSISNNYFFSVSLDFVIFCNTRDKKKKKQEKIIHLVVGIITTVSTIYSKLYNESEHCQIYLISTICLEYHDQVLFNKHWKVFFFNKIYRSYCLTVSKHVRVSLCVCLSGWVVGTVPLIC